uniref:Uncharacterized protein LOC113790987 n=1 Tax=Dermatophagoides pteronyssinus TaxID=6956 RepID=A0A6P6XUJ8_DERPT|nr:uncharacterized protein LOC113790987 [Dermatophagoides pteronyssinus]
MLLSVMVPSDDEEHIRRTAYRARRRRRESDTGITGGIVLRSSSGSHGRRLVSLNPYGTMTIVSKFFFLWKIFQKNECFV